MKNFLFSIWQNQKIKTIIFILLLIVMVAMPVNAQKPVEKVEVGLYLLDIAHLNVKESEIFADLCIGYKVAKVHFAADNHCRDGVYGFLYQLQKRSASILQ